MFNLNLKNNSVFSILANFALVTSSCNPGVNNRLLGDECFLFASASDSITCGFQLVRRIEPGNQWHPTNDNLAGTDSYGNFSDDFTVSSTFSRTWNGMNFDEFLFATSEFGEWMIMTREAVGGDAFIYDGPVYNGYSGDDPRPIFKSSRSNEPYAALMFNRGTLERPNSPEDPWLSLTDHIPSVGFNFEEAMLYGENSNTGHSFYLQYGVNVFIRNSVDCV